MTKVCQKCKNKKELDSFYDVKHKNGRIYKKSVCKPCFTQNSKPYIKKWKEESSGKKVINRRKRITSKQPEFKLKRKIQARKYLENNTESVILYRTKQRAAKCNLPFNLELSDIVIPKICPLLEIPIIIGTKEDYRQSPSIDKIIPELGYVKGNVRIISMMANTMKNSANKELLRIFAKNIVKYIDNNDIV